MNKVPNDMKMLSSILIGNGQDTRKSLCIFYDETASDNNILQLQDIAHQITSLGFAVYYITAAITAGSIMELHAPTLLLDISLPSPKEAQFSLTNCKQLSTTPTDDVFQENYLTNATVGCTSDKQNIVVHTVDNVIENNDVDTNEVKKGLIHLRTNVLPKPGSESDDIDTAAGKRLNEFSSPNTKMQSTELVNKALRVDVSTTVASDKVSKKDNIINGTKRKRATDWLMADESDTENNHDAQQPLPKRSKPAAGVNGQFTDKTAIQFSLESSSTGTNKLRNANDNIIIDSEEWISIEKKLNDVNICRANDENPLTNDESVVENIQSVILVRKLVDENDMNAVNNELYTKSSDSSNDCIIGMGKNVKKFTKNIVKKVDRADRIRLGVIGEKVLPKQSERELQLRLEFEQVQAQQMVAEAMFSDNFGSVANKKGKRKGIQ